jgi:hypothetical protein
MWRHVVVKITEVSEERSVSVSREKSFFLLEDEAVRSSETSTNFDKTAGCHIPEDSVLLPL